MPTLHNSNCRKDFAHKSQLKMLSPDGLGRMWDKDANGYARGEYVLSMSLISFGPSASGLGDK